jgi:hypothetical protein
MVHHKIALCAYGGSLIKVIVMVPHKQERTETSAHRSSNAGNICSGGGVTRARRRYFLRFDEDDTQQQ